MKAKRPLTKWRSIYTRHKKWGRWARSKKVYRKAMPRDMRACWGEISWCTRGSKRSYRGACSSAPSCSKVSEQQAVAACLASHTDQRPHKSRCTSRHQDQRRILRFDSFTAFRRTILRVISTLTQCSIAKEIGKKWVCSRLEARTTSNHKPLETEPSCMLKAGSAQHSLS